MFISAAGADTVRNNCVGCVLLTMPAAAENTDPASKAIEQETDISMDVDDNYSEIRENTTCVDCHEIKSGANTAAPQVWLTGNHAAPAPNEGMQNNDKIKDATVAVMGGRKHHRTCIAAACLNNSPLSSPSDFALDPEGMVLNGAHEKGPLRPLHVKQSPCFSLNRLRESEKWGKPPCVRFVGHAELMSEGSRAVNACRHEDGIIIEG